MTNPLNVVVFSGGRGTKAIQEAFAGVSNLAVTYLINGYDSGASTGEVRRAIAGLLGPSDFRKAITNLGALYATGNNLQISRLLEKRLPKTSPAAQDDFARLSEERSAFGYFQREAPDIGLGQALTLYDGVHAFADALAASQTRFSPADLALGNAAIAGSFLIEGSFNRAISRIARLLTLPEGLSFLNVTDGADLWLSASTEDGWVCVEEGYFVTNPPPQPITGLHLIERPHYLELRDAYSRWAKAGEPERARIGARSQRPRANPDAIRALQEADIIVYGSGTLHSSLLPSYLTDGVADAIAANHRAKKVLFVNAERDIDFHPSQTRASVVDLTLRYLDPTRAHDTRAMLDEVWITASSWDGDRQDELSGATECQGLPVRPLRHLSQNRFTASSSYMAFSEVLTREIGSTLAASEHVATVIIPVLNERPYLPRLLESIGTLHATSKGSLIEIIVVDGGSTDGTLEVVQSWDGITVLSTQSAGKVGAGGRQAAIYLGVTSARGSSIAIMHADGEYPVESILGLLNTAESSPGTLFVASRAHGAGGEFALRKVYGSSRFLYWISRLGGILVAALLSLRIGRIISDPLCGIIATDREIAKSLMEARGEHDAFMRFVMRAHQAGVPIVEIGVDYKPRSRSEGKKTNVALGIGAVKALVSFRGARSPHSP